VDTVTGSDNIESVRVCRKGESVGNLPTGYFGDVDSIPACAILGL
jgi:hypothetical protein